MRLHKLNGARLYFVVTTAGLVPHDGVRRPYKRCCLRVDVIGVIVVVVVVTWVCQSAVQSVHSRWRTHQSEHAATQSAHTHGLHGARTGPILNAVISPVLVPVY